MEKNYLVISLDSTDDLPQGTRFVSPPMTESESIIEYGKLKGALSNVYRVKIIEKEEYI